MGRRKLGHVVGDGARKPNPLKVVKPTTSTPIYDALIREVGDPFK